MRLSLKPSLSWLLVFVPVAALLEWLAPERHTLVFGAACVAVIPLAGWLGKATEHLAEHTGEGVGGLLNATFGNAAEMIIAIMALRHGLTEVVNVAAETPLLETRTGSAGQVIDEKRIALMPLSDGNPFVLARLAPGVAYHGDL